HVNHGIRPDADDEERRLRETAARLGLPFRSERLALPGSPSEEALRDARLTALERLAGVASSPSWVLLGHHRDDQVETLLLRLLRGSGPIGLAGMRRRRGIFLRPLLAVPRDELERYLEESGTAWVEDPTNRDPDRLRNRIRHRLLPLLEREIRPGSIPAIARAARHLGVTRDLQETEAARILARCRMPAGTGALRLDARLLRSYHEGWIEQTLREAVRIVRGSTADIPSPLWQDLVDSIEQARDGRFLLRPDTIVETGRGQIRIERFPDPAPEVTESVEAPLSGRIFFGDGSLQARLYRPTARPSARPARGRIRGVRRIQVFDPDRLVPPVRIRLWRKGDRIGLGPAGGTKKIVDLLSERGVPVPLRARQPVLEDRCGLLWAPGLRRDPRGTVDDATERIWILRWVGDLPADRGLPEGGARTR
ncbi:MAG: tRNA lysidine(34) synthetase TilS, partial [Candidatus Eisenbacteria bacterium]|nr:tRNA lysidine(34) synthetase TilS [Candidatus Latescibacterota bacterium]MBD3301916.1 tRNA lysidine(34) synthetase TilS [Candidatus Eisenbacteria bacterium]